MSNQKEEVEVSNSEELRTRRLEARAEMFQALPAVISSLAPIVESIAKVSTSRHETLGSRLAEVEIDRANRGDSLIETLIDLGREMNLFENLARLVESDCDLEIAENRKTIRDLDTEEDDDDNDDVIDDDNDDDNNDDDDDDVIPDRSFRSNTTGYRDLERCRCKGNGR